jgi:class 3 adenylate cyclase
MTVSILALSITAYLSFSYADEILRERAGEQLISESTVRGNSLLFLYGTRIKETQVIASDPMIQLLVDELNNSDPSKTDLLIEEKRRDFLTQVQAFQELVGFSIEFEDVKIIGKTGTVYYSLGRLGTDDFSQNQLFLRGLSEAFVDFEPAGGDKKMIVTTPIFAKDSKRTSEPIGVIIAKMRTAAIDTIVLDRSGLGETGEVYIVDENHLMLSESRFLENVIFRQKVDTLPVKKCFEEGEEVVGIYPDYRAVSIYGSSFCARDLGFILLAEIDEAETVQPILVLQESILQTGLVITAGMVIVAFVLARSISKPIIKLRNAARDIAQGNFDVRTNIATKDEIGDLSSSFDFMVKKLTQSLVEIKEKENVIKQQEDILLQFSDYSEKYCVCMVDIMNSTKITANLSDSETSEFYKIFLNSTAVIVRNFGGIVVKNIGDALLFYFAQLPSTHEEIFKKTLECCLKLGESSDIIKEKLEKEKLPVFDYRISATYGPVRIARLSTSSVNDIFGTTVNRCAKINRAAPGNGIIIGEEFYKNAKNLTDYHFKKISEEMATEFGFTGYIVSRKSTEENP